MFSSLNKAAGFRRFIHEQISVQKAKTSQPKPVNYNFWFIDGYVEAHWWRCGGSLIEVRRLIGGDVVAH